MTRIDDDFHDIQRASDQRDALKRQERSNREKTSHFQELLHTKQKLSAEQQNQEQQKREQRESSFKQLTSMRDKVRQHEMKSLLKTNERWLKAQEAAQENTLGDIEERFLEKDQVEQQQESVRPYTSDQVYIAEVESQEDAQRNGGHRGGGDTPDQDEEKRHQPEGGMVEGVVGPGQFHSVIASEAAAYGGMPAELSAVFEAIVQAVHSGFDLKGLGVIQIELKDNVLSGARLLLRSNGQGGLLVKITTSNDSVKRLLSAGSTAKELSQALGKKGIRLLSFEVNEDKVIG
jgi:hypothetical protein